MPNAETFSIPDFGDIVRKYLRKSQVSVDPFARNKRWATYTNDINPNTAAEDHMEARDYLRHLIRNKITADLVIFDPPYSPRQVSEVYSEIGLTATMKDTQTAHMKKECRTLIRHICEPGSVVLSFGWNTVGMGPGWETLEILLVCHGGDHNDTICMVEQMKHKQEVLYFEN
ncbi:MAG: adenine-specific DNA methylase [Verrucomicrobiota bacterium]